MRNPSSPLRDPAFRRLLAVSVTVALGFGMIVPVLPVFARSFGVGLAAVGLVQLVFGLTRFVSGPVGGVLVDRFGDRVCTAAGLAVVAVSSVAAGSAGSFPELVAARGLGGAGSALFMTGLLSRILRIVPPAAMGRATGQFRSSFLVGVGAGPFLGGLVAGALGARATFYFYAAALVLALGVALRVMDGAPARDRLARRSPLQALRAAAPLLGDRRYTAALGATLAGWWVLSGPAQTVGPVFGRERLGLSPEAVGAAVTLLAAGEIAALLVAGRIADRLGRKIVLVPSLAVTAAGVALLGQAGNAPWAYFPLMVAVGAGVAASGVAAGGLLADSLPRGGSGPAVGVNQMAGDLGYLLSPSLVGLAAERWGYGWAYLLAALPPAGVLAWSLGLPAARPTGAPEPESAVEPLA